MVVVVVFAMIGSGAIASEKDEATLLTDKFDFYVGQYSISVNQNWSAGGQRLAQIVLQPLTGSAKATVIEVEPGQTFPPNQCDFLKETAIIHTTQTGMLMLLQALHHEPTRKSLRVSCFYNPAGELQTKVSGFEVFQ